MALPKFYKVVQDQQGNIVPQVLGSVFNHGTAVLASLYNDDAGTVPLSNPMTSDAQYGSFKFYVNPGHYDLTFTKPGYTFEPIYDMQVPQDVLTLGTMAQQNADAVAITGGTITGLAALGAQNGNLDTLGLGRAANPAYALALLGQTHLDGNLVVTGTLTTTGLDLTAPLALADGGTGAIDAAAARTNLGLGTMSLQNANAVTITAGVLSGVDVGATQGFAATWGVGQGHASAGLTLEVTGNARVNGATGLNHAATTNVALTVGFNKASQSGQIWHQTTDDGGAGQPVIINNVAGTQIGSISTTGSATAYNTSSDGRLKEAIAPLTGALETLMRFLPRQFRWRSTGQAGVGFVAEELAGVVEGVTTGTPGAVHPDGTLDPMGMDASKLVVWTIGALQEVVTRLEQVEARLAALDA